MASDEWSKQVAATVAAQIRRHRKRRGMTGQDLSDATTRLGHAIPRAILTNFENGRRPTISIAELLIIARALDVPPLVLVFPVGIEARIEVLPEVGALSPFEAWLWAAGFRDLPDAEGETYDRRRYGSAHEFSTSTLSDYETAALPVDLYHRHEAAMIGHDLYSVAAAEVADELQAAKASGQPTGTLEQRWQNYAGKGQAHLWRLGRIRRRLADAGLLLPPIPESLERSIYGAPTTESASGDDLYYFEGDQP